MSDQDRSLEWARASTDELARIGDSLSIRATGVLATASLIMGVTAASGDLEWCWPIALFFTAVACYVGVLYTSLRVMLVRQSLGPGSPRILHKHYWPWTPIRWRRLLAQPRGRLQSNTEAGAVQGYAPALVSLVIGRRGAVLTGVVTGRQLHLRESLLERELTASPTP